MNKNFYCIFREGAALTDPICDLLFDSAQEMIRDRTRKCKLDESALELEGQISTKFASTLIGTVSGICFEAVMDISRCRVRVNFVVQPGNENIATLRKRGGEWRQIKPTPYDWN